MGEQPTKRNWVGHGVKNSDGKYFALIKFYLDLRLDNFSIRLEKKIYIFFPLSHDSVGNFNSLLGKSIKYLAANKFDVDIWRIDFARVFDLEEKIFVEGFKEHAGQLFFAGTSGDNLVFFHKRSLNLWMGRICVGTIYESYSKL